MVYSKEQANQSLYLKRETKPSFFWGGGDTCPPLCPRKTEVIEALPQVKFLGPWNMLVWLNLAFRVDRGWRGKYLCCPPLLAENNPAKHPNWYLIKAQTEREQNGLAVSISCKWSVPRFVNPLHVSLLMPLSRVVCKVGRTFSPLALNISAKELQIPRKLSLWILYGSREISKSSLKHNTRSLRLYSVPAAFSKRVDPHQRGK